MYKILVTGSNGQLGSELKNLENSLQGYEFLFVDIEDLDITNEIAVRDFFSVNEISYCINCAAYTAVDKAEQERIIAVEINANGPKILSEACKSIGAVFIHISTDFVFDGKINTPYKESHYARPLSIYGKTKRKGEVEALVGNPKTIVIRTSWLYSAYGNNFLKTMRRLGKERDSLGVVYDQIGAPTYANDLAQVITKIITYLKINEGEEVFGVYHYSNAGIASWYDFAIAVFELSQLSIKVKPLLTEEYPLPAKRPTYSVLDTKKIRDTFNIEIPHWRKSLSNCITEIEKNA